MLTVASTGLPSQTVTATQLDTSTLGLSVSGTALSVLEGSVNTCTVQLTAQPTNTITVTATRTSGSTNLTVTGGATLTFTPANWNAAQTVTLACAEDADTVNETAVITVASTGLPSPIMNVTGVDNDTLGLNVSPLALNVTEGGSNSFTVALTAAPTANVTVTTSRSSGSSNLNILTGGVLTFTPGNWNVAQTVMIGSTSALDITNDVATFDVSSSGLTPHTVVVTEQDTTALSFNLSTSTLAVPEGGSNTYTVVLTAIPTNSVTINTSRTSGSTNLTVVTGGSLTFNAGNWNTPQTVRIFSANDFDAVPDAAVFTSSATGLPSQTLTATQTEKDSLQMTVAPASLTVLEGARTHSASC